MRIHPSSLIRIFPMHLISKQGHKASESNQTELVTHAISVLQ